MHLPDVRAARSLQQLALTCLLTAHLSANCSSIANMAFILLLHLQSFFPSWARAVYLGEISQPAERQMMRAAQLYESAVVKGAVREILLKQNQMSIACWLEYSCEGQVISYFKSGKIFTILFLHFPVWFLLKCILVW